MGWIADVISGGDRLFSKRGNLLEFWQSIAEQFSPVCADFTTTRYLGEDYAADLMTSYPLIVARELVDTFSHMLRPSEKVWAEMEVEGLKDYEGRRFLEWATKTQRRAMYDKPAQFVAAAKSGDRDFGLFGQAVLTVELMPDRSSLLYRKWHLRDVAWRDGLNGAVEEIHRKWKPEAIELMRIFGENKLHPKVKEHLQPGKDPYCTVQCRHVVVPALMYHGEVKFRTPLVSLYIDVDNEHLIEATGLRVNPYVIPRWQRIDGTPYACSPATICALPEARLLQAMTFTLLEAGEKYVRPPLLATEEMIRGDIDVRADGITWVSAEYDERMGEVLRPLTQDKSGMPLGLELQQRSEDMLRRAFYADKLQMPQRGGPQETAYEVGQRVQQFIRDALPLVEPVEVDYNGGLCEATFAVMAANGGFGPPDTWPKSLRGEDIQFKFVSPLRDAMDKQKGEVFIQASQIVSQAVALDPASGSVVDAASALRDTLEGIGVPMPWMRSPEAVKAIADEQARMAQQQQLLQSMEQAAGVVKSLGTVPAGQVL